MIRHYHRSDDVGFCAHFCFAAERRDGCDNALVATMSSASANNATLEGSQLKHAELLVCRNPQPPVSRPRRSFVKDRLFYLAACFAEFFAAGNLQLSFFPLNFRGFRAREQNTRGRFMHELRVDFRIARFLNETADYANLL
jgi:hypothetical protein